jgi:hypothetical protein
MIANSGGGGIGGRGGIRTHEGAEPPAGFQDQCLKPLGHPSFVVKSIVYRNILGKRIAPLVPDPSPEQPLAPATLQKVASMNPAAHVRNGMPVDAEPVDGEP